MNDGTVLTVRRLQKTYSGFQLGPVDMRLESGYVYAIMGPNGSGKSTLFRLLNGIIQPEQGSMEWLEPKYGASEREVKRQVAYVPDELDIPDEGWTLSRWSAFVSAWYPGWNGRKYRELVKRYELDEHKPMRKASKGTRRKAALVTALAQEPRVLLLDEPSSGLDPFAWRMMMEDLAEFMSTGDRTIVLATHIMEEIRRLGDYVFFMHGGRMFGAYEKDELNDGWKVLWVDSLPNSAMNIPGVVAIENKLPLRLVTHSPEETERALDEMGISIVNQNSLELDELFWHVIRKNEKSPYRKES